MGERRVPRFVRVWIVAMALASAGSAAAQWVDPPPYVPPGANRPQARPPATLSPPNVPAPSAAPANPRTPSARAAAEPPGSGDAGKEQPVTGSAAHAPVPPARQQDEVAPGPSPSGTDDFADKSARFLTDYLKYWSRSNVVDRRSMEAFYQSSVQFYGRLASLQDVMAEKRRFIQRWPLRDYAALPGTTRVTCAPGGSLCMVAALFSFVATDPTRRRASQGTGRLELEVAFDKGRPLIAAERSNVLSRESRDLPLDTEPGLEAE
jgi:hypothetical protein